MPGPPTKVPEPRENQPPGTSADQPAKRTAIKRMSLAKIAGSTPADKRGFDPYNSARVVKSPAAPDNKTDEKAPA